MKTESRCPAMDLLTEDLMPLAEAAELVNVHTATVHRWRSRGLNGVKLETLRLGGKISTSRQALTRFIERTQ
ncbi:hypothetical protein Mal15_17790 [Stieleria maiorica]|uniref:Uncharacterized protein n=1 Tax=Stieleria maiorica TaxID=2795974 RepID=A0A5B9ME25_9BACT|nr:DUF1580 domain-containing protein [Stieleria maiorica]QEF97735.1 hypothetical protein Mal15_17790 [Stieleria maiorica]